MMSVYELVILPQLLVYIPPLKTLMEKIFRSLLRNSWIMLQLNVDLKIVGSR